MSRLKKSLLAICVLANLTVAASAAAAGYETNVSVNGYSAHVTGSADCGAGTEVSIAVVRPGKDIFTVVEDTAATEETLLNNNVVLLVQTVVDDEKEFEYNCKFDGNEKSGVYTLRVQVYGEPEVREKTFVFENDSRKQLALEKIKSNNADDIEVVLKEYATDIDIQSGEKYITFTDKEKEYVLKNVADSNDNKVNEYTSSVNEISLVREMKALDKEGLKALVEKGNVIGVENSLIREYTSLTSLKKDVFVADLYTKIKNSETPDEIGAVFAKSIEDAKKSSAQSQGGGGGGSSGGGSSGKGSAVSSVSVKGTPTVEADATYVLEAPENEGFTDMENTLWAKSAVEQLYARGIINGRSENMFCPNDTVTREEFLKMVVESLNIVGISEINKGFNDVNAGAWYSHYIDTGIGCGIINGISETEFGVGMSITREDMATILHRAVQYGEVNLYSVEDNTFIDENDISDYAKDAVKALSSANVINGMEDGSFMPKKTATRAEAAVMLYNLLYR